MTGGEDEADGTGNITLPFHDGGHLGNGRDVRAHGRRSGGGRRDDDRLVPDGRGRADLRAHGARREVETVCLDGLDAPRILAHDADERRAPGIEIQVRAFREMGGTPQCAIRSDRIDGVPVIRVALNEVHRALRGEPKLVEKPDVKDGDAGGGPASGVEQCVRMARDGSARGGIDGRFG